MLDDWQERRGHAEEQYEDALIAANSARIGTSAFLDAMASVKAAREQLREIDALRPR